MLSKAVEWKLMRVAPKIKLAKVRGRDALIDPKTEGSSSKNCKNL
jgi:hypothetical protein